MYQISDFIWIETVLEDDRFPLDTSQTSGVVDFLYQLNEEFNGQEDINSTVPVHFKIGSIIKLSNDAKYTLTDIKIEFVASYYDGATDRPLMILRLVLRRN